MKLKVILTLFSMILAVVSFFLFPFKYIGVPLQNADEFCLQPYSFEPMSGLDSGSAFICMLWFFLTVDNITNRKRKKIYALYLTLLNIATLLFVFYADFWGIWNDPSEKMGIGFILLCVASATLLYAGILHSKTKDDDQGKNKEVLDDL